MSSTIFTHPDDTIANRHEQLRQAARKRWPEWAAGDLDNRSGYLIDKGSGLLFRPVPHVVFARGVEVAPRRRHRRFLQQRHGRSTSSSAPRTPAPLPNSRRRKRHAHAEQEREQAHADFIASQPLRTVTLAELEGDPTSVPTLRQAVCQLYGLGGRTRGRRPRPTRPRPLTPRRRPQRRPHRQTDAAENRPRHPCRPQRHPRRAREGQQDTPRRPAPRPARRRGRRTRMSDSRRTLIRPGQLAFARGDIRRRRTDELKRERAQLRADALEAAQRTLDRIDLELAGFSQIRTRELAVDLAASGFDTTGLTPLRLPTARRHRGRADLDPLTRARAEEAADRGRLIRVFTPHITIR